MVLRAGLLALAALLLQSCLCEDELVFQALKDIQSKINANMEPFCYTSHSGTRQAFLTQAYKQYTGSYNVLIYPFCLETRELGNRLGNYLQEVACAEASGLHFIAIHPQWDIKGSFHGNFSNISDSQQLAFLSALPTLIVHKQPLDSFHAQAQIKHHCHCTRYCWGHVKAPWVNRTESLVGVVELHKRRHFHHDSLDQMWSFHRHAYANCFFF
jgi:hypothetical protein